MDAPPCPACGQAASQATVRETQTRVHEGTYLCACGCLWQTRWFAAPAPGAA